MIKTAARPMAHVNDRPLTTIKSKVEAKGVR